MWTCKSRSIGIVGCLGLLIVCSALAEEPVGKRSIRSGLASAKIGMTTEELVSACGKPSSNHEGHDGTKVLLYHGSESDAPLSGFTVFISEGRVKRIAPSFRRTEITDEEGRLIAYVPVNGVAKNDQSGFIEEIVVRGVVPEMPDKDLTIIAGYILESLTGVPEAVTDVVTISNECSVVKAFQQKRRYKLQVTEFGRVRLSDLLTILRAAMPPTPRGAK